MEINPVIAYPIWNGRDFPADRKSCLILMPFGETWSDTIFLYISEIVEKLGMTVQRADLVSGHIIMEDVWKLLNEATIVIADITSNNPNVFYELGIAHTLGKNVILLSQSSDHMPFDISSFRKIIYRVDENSLKLLGNQLPNYIQPLLESHPTGNPLLDEVLVCTKKWEAEKYEYGNLLSPKSLQIVKDFLKPEAMTAKALAYCLSTTTFYGAFEDIEYWFRLNKKNDYAAMVMGQYVLMRFRRVRYRAAFLLQCFDQDVKRAGMTIIDNEGTKKKLLTAIECGKVRDFVETNVMAEPDLDQSIAMQLIKEFDFIEKFIPVAP